MSDKDNGGAAFPVVHPDGMGVQYFGLSMRDYFAAKAMQGLLTRPGSIDPKQDAEFAYMIADAMLAARDAQ